MAVYICNTLAGPPESVKNVTTYSSLVSIHLSWEAPFSLNLTTAEPDFAYCVEICRVIAMNNSWREEESLSLISGDCNVSTTGFVYNSTTPDPLDRYKFIIIPRSNIFGAKNGTPSEPVIGAFLGIL